MNWAHWLERLLPRSRWGHLVVVLVAMGAGWLAADTWRRGEEEHLRLQLGSAAQRAAEQLQFRTWRGTAMGAATLLGLDDAGVKAVVQGRLPPNDPGVLARLRAARLSLEADGVYLINAQGVVVAHETENVQAVGVNVSYRPYWQQAMAGRNSVYPAVGTVTSGRGVFVVAPVRAGDTADGPALGAVAVKLLADELDVSVAHDRHTTLLLSPQGLVYATNRPDWLFQFTHPLDEAQLTALRRLRQFGSAVEGEVGRRLLPFDPSADEVWLQGQRHLVAHVPVVWSDPAGDWRLVSLGDVGAVAPLAWQLAVAAVVAGLVYGLIFLAWRGGHEMLAHRAALARSAEASRELAQAGRLQHQQSEFTWKLQQARDIPALAEAVWGPLAELVPLHQGAFYFHDALQEGRPTLQLAGCYGAAGAPLRIALGEGLVGQCAQERRVLSFSPVPAGFWRVVSGLGEATPRALLLLPVVRNEQLLGVLELSSMRADLADAGGRLEPWLPVLAMNLEILLGERRMAQTLFEAQTHAGEVQAQQAHSQHIERWYQSVLYGAPDGLLVADDAGRIILCNRALQQLFGYDDGEMVGLSVDELLPTALRHGHAAMRQAFATQGDQPLKMAGWRPGLMGLRKDGTEVAVSITLAALPESPLYGRCVCAVVRPESTPKPE